MTAAAPSEQDATEICSFWLDDVGADRWYVADPALDDAIRARFLPLWERGAAGELDEWASATPRMALAALLLLDQFSRNMFRGEGRAFSTDERARRLARVAIAAGFDLQTPEPERQFFYLPLMHSEELADQDDCLRLFETRMPDTGARNLPFAVEHRDTILKFGRFPYRNEALGRETTPAEAAWLAARDGAKS